MNRFSTSFQSLQATTQKPAAVLLLATLMLAPTSLAATSSYYLNPTRAELTVSPRNNIASGTIQVTSSAKQTIRLKAAPKLWRLSTEGAIEYYAPPTEGFNLLDNVRFNPAEFELAPGRIQNVRYVVKIPNTMPDGEYPLQVYFEPVELLKPQEVDTTTKGVKQVLNVVPVFTTTLYIYKGKTEPKVRVDSLNCKIDPQTKMLRVDTQLNNTGTKHARLFGKASLYNAADKTATAPVSTFDLKKKSLLLVFPDKVRQYKEDLATSSKDGAPLQPGRYKIDLNFVDEREQQPAIPSTCEFSL